jgi:uncharacterized membrane protein YdcZ (DUF606 family)
VRGPAAAVLEVVHFTSFDGVIGATVLAATSVFVRRRRARAQERLQLKWFAYAAGLFAAIVAGSVILDDLIGLPQMDSVVPVLFGVALNALFAAVAVAVLRYRLYEIDRLVSRTVSYALLTALLAGVYLGGVLLLAPVLGRGSDLAVAAATLAAAALFAPARRRIQHVVDRRFNRARYDAELVVTRLRERLRHDVELDDVIAVTCTAGSSPNRLGSA